MLHTDPALTPRLAARMGKAADMVYKTASDHAMVALRIPVHVAEQIKIKGGERAANLHCTLVYLGDVAEIDPANLRTLQARLTVIGQTEPPLEGRIAGYGRFAESEDEDVIWCGLDAPDLAELRHRVLQAVMDSGIVPVGDHGFTPHITLAYVESGEGEDSMPPNVDVAIKYLSLSVGTSEIMIPLKGPRPIPELQPVLSAETFSDLQGPSVEFTRMLDLERWAQNQGSLMVRADVPGIGCVVVKKGTDIAIGLEAWDGNVRLNDLLAALGAIKHDFIMVGRLAAWDAAVESWVDGPDMAPVLLAERVATPVFFAADVLVLDRDISRLPARERFERLRLLVTPAGGSVCVPLQREVKADMELDAHVDEIAEWKPSGREGGWYCPGVTVVSAASPYAHGTSENEVRLVFRVRKDEGLIGIGSGGGVQERPIEIIDERIRKPHFPDIRPIAAQKDWDESKHPRDPGGDGGGQFTSGGGSVEQAHTEFLKQIETDPKVQAARKAIRETPETIRQYKKDGEYTPERTVLHDKIVGELLNANAAVPEGETPTATIMIGLPASGKSNVLRPTIPNIDKATVIEADAVKEKLPEYNGKNAASVHQESADVAEGPLLNAALDARHNLVFDMVGRRKHTMLSLAAELKEAGYAVDLRHVTVPPIEAAKRALQRFDETGRFVDPSYILNDVGHRSDETYEALKNSGAVRSWESYDNSGPYGSKPKLREHGGSPVRVRRGANGAGYPEEVQGEEVSKDGGVAGGTFGTAGTSGILAPQQGMFRKPKRSRTVNKGEIRTDLTLLKAWTDEARAAALEARREGTVVGEDWKFPNPMSDMAEYDPTPNDEPRARIKPNVWEPPRLHGRGEVRRWQDGDSFSVGYGVVGGHTFRCGTLKDGQFVPDKKQPRVNPYEAIFQRKGVLLGLGTVTKSQIDQAQQDRDLREQKQHDQAAIVGALVAMSEAGVSEEVQIAIVVKHYLTKAWTDEARAAALETRRRNAMGKVKPVKDPDATGIERPSTPGGRDEYKVRMRDANGETMVGPDGTVYSGGPHVRLAASVGESTDSSIEAGYVRAVIAPGLLAIEFDQANPTAKANTVAMIRAHGKDARIHLDFHQKYDPSVKPHERVKGTVSLSFDTPGKALRHLETGDESEATHTFKAEFDESKHPRDEGGEGGGQFTAGGGGAPAAEKPAGHLTGGTGPVTEKPVGTHAERGAKLEAQGHAFYSPTKGHGDLSVGPSSYSGAQGLITNEARKGMTTEAASRSARLFNWAWTYGKGDPSADLLLAAASKEWGGDIYHRGYPGKSAPKVTDVDAYTKQAWGELTSTATKNPNPGNPMQSPPVEQGVGDFQEYLKIQYAATQAHLKSSPENVVLYRGMSTEDKKLMKKGGKIKLKLGAMSSTSGDPKKAAMFGNVVMRITVPKTAIVGTWRSGMGAEELDEVVVLGGKQDFDAEIVRVGKPARMKAALSPTGETDFVSSGLGDGELTPSPLSLSLIDENGWERKTTAKPPKDKSVKKEEGFDETEHPRAEDGKWTDGSQATKPPKTPDSLNQPSLPGLEAAGRTWEPENEADKVRQLYLEEESHAAIGAAKKDWDDLVGEEITVEGKGGWDSLSDDDKSEYQNQWENDNVEQYIEEATKEWQDSSEASSKKAEAASEQFYDKISDSDLDAAVREAIKGTGAFSGSDAAREYFLDNMEANRMFQMGEAEDDRELDKAFDSIMEGYTPEDESEEKPEFDASSFSGEIRSQYETMLERVAEDIEVEPDDDAKETISQNAYEAVSEAFHSQSQDDLDSLVGDGNSTEEYVVEEPKQWLLEKPSLQSAGIDLTKDPTDSGTKRLRQAERDYETTRKAAQALVGKRAEALWRERNPLAEGAEEDSDYMPNFHTVGDEFWNEWKRNSNAPGTRGMQNALIKELGVNSLGRQGTEEPSGAQAVYAKALWQTTQFVLHKANVREVHAYRAVMLAGDDLGRLQPPTEHLVPVKPFSPMEHPDPNVPREPPKKYSEFTDLNLKQATAQSFTFDKSVANNWGGMGNQPKNAQRVVLRATVPPEAVWSLPVYGKNLQNENEVVILGTPWKKWEAWDKHAPDLEEVPIKRIQTTEIEKPKKTPDNLGKDL